MIATRLQLRPEPGAGRTRAYPPRTGHMCQQRGEADGVADTQLPIDISDAFLADILKPYRPNAKYLKSAQITHCRDETSKSSNKPSLMRGTGRFTIPESCYIADTGHFNAVEFNICYNQLAYVLFGKCIETGILQALKFLTFADYKRHQLPSWLIVSAKSRYFEQLTSDTFRGELALNRAAQLGAVWFFFTTVTFSDLDGIKANGSVVLAFSPLEN
jgi:hypothetical protein